MTKQFNDLSLYQGAESRSVLNAAKKKEIAATITPELADQLGKSYILGRLANPELVASAAVAGIGGIDDLYKNLQTQLLKQGVVPEQAIDKNEPSASSWTNFVNAKPGQTVTVTDPRTGKPMVLTVAGTPTAAITAKGQEATGLRERSAEEIAAQQKRQTELEKRVPVVNLDTAKDRYSLRGMQGPSGFREGLGASSVVSVPFEAVGVPFHFVGSAISLMAPDQLEIVAKSVRAATKTASLPFQTAGEFTYNFAASTIRDAYVAGMMDASPWERFKYAVNPGRIVNNLGFAAANTTGAQTIFDIADGNLDVGGGFFVSGETGKRAQEQQTKYLGSRAQAEGIDSRTIYDPQQRAFYEQPFNPGFVAGEMLVDSKLTSRDSEIYQIASDVTDLGMRIGLDPSTYYDPIPVLMKRLGLAKNVATEYVAAKRAGDFEEAMRVATENAIDTKVADLLTNAERQKSVAKSVFEQQPNIVYSGDRSFETGKTIESFLDVDDPNFVPNTQNLFGEGLYVTDQAVVASTQGYNVPGSLDWNNLTQDQLVEFQNILPDGAFYGNTGLNKGNAGVWKFDMSNLNILDGEGPVTQNVIDLFTNAVTRSVGEPTIFTALTKDDYARQVASLSSHAESFIQALNDVPEFRDLMYSPGGFYATPEFFIQQIKQFNEETFLATALSGEEQFLAKYPQYKTIEEAANKFANAVKESEQYKLFVETNKPIIDLLINTYGLSREVAEGISPLIIESSFGSGYTGVSAFGPQLVAERASKFSTVNELFKDLYNSTANKPQLNGPRRFDRLFMTATNKALSKTDSEAIIDILAAIDDGTNGGNLSATELLATAMAPYTNVESVKNLLTMPNNSKRTVALQKLFNETFAETGAATTSTEFVKALVDAGYDGINYNGGTRIGGAGVHTATVVWKPSKLQQIDILSGEKFPINQAVSALDDADKFRIRAEELQTMRETHDGWRQAVGLIDEAPRSLEPNALNAMRYTKTGQKILAHIAEEKSPVVIWRDVLRRRSPKAAIALAKASTPEAVWQALQEAVYSNAPDMNIRELPNGWKDWVSDTGYKVKQNVDRYSRQTAMMPDSTYIPFDDASVALERADRVLQVSGVRGAERDAVLTKLFVAIDTGTSKSWDKFFEAANEKALASRMKRAGWTPEETRLFTSYRWKGDNVTRWTLEDLADNVPIEWFDEGDGPLRVTQLLSGGGWMVEPAVLDKLMRDLNPVIRGIRKITKNNPGVAKSIEAGRVATKAVETSLRNFIKPAALGAPLPVRYMMRVALSEEPLRVAFSHEFDSLGQYVAQIASGHLDYDTFGNIIMDSQKAAKKMAALENIKYEYEAFNQLTDPAEIAKAQRRIDKFEKKYGTIDELQAQIDELSYVINESIPSAQRQLVNKVRGHVESTYDKATLRDYLERSDIQQVVTRKVNDLENLTRKEKVMRKHWVTAQARDIAEMTANKDYRAVAKALQDGNAATLERVAKEMLDGDLSDIYDEYVRNVFNVKKDWDWNTIEAARSRVNEIRKDIQQRAALHPDVLDVIATGKLGDESVLMQTETRAYEATDSFKKFIRETLLDNPDAPDQVPFYPDSRTNVKQTRNTNWMYNSFWMYSEASAALSRNPMWAHAYWNRIVELAPAMDKDALQSMITANKGKLADYMIDRLEDALPRANGTLKQNEVSRIAEVFAKEKTDALLYNAENNKSYFGYRHQILFMFFDAYREQWQTWLKLMKNPRNLHAVDVATRELKNFREPFTKEDNYILHNDPTTGKQVVTVPLSRWLYRLVGGDAQLSIATRNLSLVGSVAPGFSPVITLFASSWKPDEKTWADVKSTLFPYATGDVSIDPRDYMIPQFWQYFATGTAGVGQKYAAKFDTFWNLLEKSAGPIVEKTKKASLVPIMRQLAQNVDKYPPGAEGTKLLLDDANALADRYAVVRAFAKSFLPASPTTQFYAKTKQGTVIQGVLLDEIRKTEQEVMGNGGTLSQAITTLLDRYGLGLWAFFGSGSKSNIPGLQPTKEYQNWVFENKNIIEKYPFAGGYLGPQKGEYNNRIYVQQALIGQRTPKDPKEAIQEAENLLADAWWDNLMSTIPVGQEKTDDAVRFRAEKRYEILQRFPNWNPLTPAAEAQTKRTNQMLELEKMVKDSEVLSMPGGQALKTYMDARRNAVRQMIDFAPDDVNISNWTNVQASYSLRQYLLDEGTRLVQENPDFAPMWVNVLSKEFDTKDLKVPAEVTP